MNCSYDPANRGVEQELQNDSGYWLNDEPQTENSEYNTGNSKYHRVNNYYNRTNYIHDPKNRKHDRMNSDYNTKINRRPPENCTGMTKNHTYMATNNGLHRLNCT